MTTRLLSKLMDDGETPRCQERVYRAMGNWGNSGQCYRRGVAEDEDGWRCKQHSAAEVERRRAVQDEKYAREYAALRLRIFGPTFFDVLKQIAEGHNDPRRIAREAVDEFEKER